MDHLALLRADRSAPEGAPSPFVPILPVYRALLVGALFAYLVGVGVLAYFRGESTTVWIFLALGVNVALVALPLVFYRPEFGWAHPVIVHALLVFLISHLVRTPLYIRGLEYHVALPDWSRDALARLVAYELVLGAVALAAYYAGFFCGLSPGVPRLRFHRPRGTVVKSLLVIAAVAVVFALYIRSQGGVTSHMLSWAELGRTDAVRGEGHWLRISRLGGLMALIWLAYDRRALRRPYFWLAGGMTLAINFLGSGSRSSVVFLLLVATLIWILRSGKIVPVRALLVAALCLLLLASLGRLRKSLFWGDVDWGALYSVGAVDSLRAVVDELIYRYGSLDSSYPVLARVPHEVDFLYGSTYLSLLALPIPRAVWPDKPGTVGKLAGQIFYDVKAGIPPGAVGEAYWNFHVPGVIAVFFLFGVGHRFAARFLLRYCDEPGAWVLFALTAMWIQPSVLAAADWTFSTVSVLALLWLLGALRLTHRQGERIAAEPGHHRLA